MQQKMGLLNLISVQARQHRYEQDKDAAEDGSAKLNIDTGKTTSIMSKTRLMKPGRTRH